MHFSPPEIPESKANRFLRKLFRRDKEKTPQNESKEIQAQSLEELFKLSQEKGFKKVVVSVKHDHYSYESGSRTVPSYGTEDIFFSHFSTENKQGTQIIFDQYYKGASLRNTNRTDVPAEIEKNCRIMAKHDLLRLAHAQKLTLPVFFDGGLEKLGGEVPFEEICEKLAGLKPPYTNSFPPSRF